MATDAGGQRSPFLAALWGDSRAPLPSGPRSRSDEEIAAVHRRRLIAAMAECLSEHDYPSTTVADVVARAQVSRRTFYAHFADREDCFLAAYEAAADLLMAQIAEAVANEPGGWEARIAAGTTAYLKALAEEPGLSRVFLLHILSAGPAALRRRDMILRRFAELLGRLAELHREELPDNYAVNSDMAYAMVGAIDELCRKAIAEDCTSAIAGLYPITERLVHAVLAVGATVGADE